MSETEVSNEPNLDGDDDGDDDAGENTEQFELVNVLPAELPEEFFVHSKVRHVSTRTVRSRQPTRHRFKQYLFGNPSLRLVRKRPVRITAEQLVQNLDELLTKEGSGLLSVHLRDGRQLNLTQLKAGAADVMQAPPTPAMYNRRIDSIAHDVPAGNPMPQYIDGTFPGDPAAQRATERMTAEKQHEAARKGASAPPPAEPAEPAASVETALEVAVVPETSAESEPEPVAVAEQETFEEKPMEDGTAEQVEQPEGAVDGIAESMDEGSSEEAATDGETEEETATEEEVPAAEETASVVDPAAQRAATPQRGGKKSRRNR